MASKSGWTISEIEAAVRSFNRSVKNIAIDRIDDFSRDISPRRFANMTVHDVRRGLERIDEIQAAVDSWGSTPTIGRDALRALAEQEFGDTYDIIGETATLRNLLVSVRSTARADIEALGYTIGPGPDFILSGPLLSLAQDDRASYDVMLPAAGIAATRNAWIAVRDHISG